MDLGIIAERGPEFVRVFGKIQEVLTRIGHLRPSSLSIPCLCSQNQVANAGAHKIAGKKGFEVSKELYSRHKSIADRLAKVTE
jgi:hypothetical protein